MKFIGQKHIMEYLSFLLPELYEGTSGINLLLRGFSGCGKTTLALKIGNYLSKTSGDFVYSICSSNIPVSFSEKHRIYILDEVHLLREPELLYPIMDKKQYIIILCTNETSELKEPLINRCINLSFVNYNKEDLITILTDRLGHIILHSDIIDEIIDAGGGNPRILVTYAFNIRMVLRHRPELIDNQKELIKVANGIQRGLNPLCVLYLRTLEKLGGIASLDRIASLSKIPKQTILFEVEPILLYQEIIQITSKGRMFNGKFFNSNVSGI